MVCDLLGLGEEVQGNRSENRTGRRARVGDVEDADRAGNPSEQDIVVDSLLEEGTAAGSRLDRGIDGKVREPSNPREKEEEVGSSHPARRTRDKDCQLHCIIRTGIASCLLTS